MGKVCLQPLSVSLLWKGVKGTAESFILAGFTIHLEQFAVFRGNTKENSCLKCELHKWQCHSILIVVTILTKP